MTKTKLMAFGVLNKKKRTLVVQASKAGKKAKCPRCNNADTVYVHLDHDTQDPISPEYVCVACKHEWDQGEERL